MSTIEKAWGACVNISLLRIGLGILGGALFSHLTETAVGIILGAIGSSFLMSEMPVAVGTGLGIGWALRHCKNIMRKAEPPEAKPPEEDPCACCNSNFEALDNEEFEFNFEPTAPKQPPIPQPCEVYEAEDQCTCNEIPATWSPPRPVEDTWNHPEGCSCYR